MWLFFLQQLQEFTNLNDLDSEVKKEQVVPTQSEDESITYVLDTETGKNLDSCCMNIQIGTSFAIDPK